MEISKKALDYSKEEILIVDDDNHLRTTLEKLLSSRGFSVKSAQSADAAVKMILEDGSDGFTFVLTDMKMPGMSGMDLIKEINIKTNIVKIWYVLILKI